MIGLFVAASPASALADGARVFGAKCATCHGLDGKGQTKQGVKMKVASMADPAWQKRMTDAEIKRAIEDGIDRTKDGVKQKMSPFKGKLTDEQITALVAFIRGLK